MRNSRLLARITVALLLTLILAACGSPATTAPTAAPATTAPAPTAAPAATLAPAPTVAATVAPAPTTAPTAAAAPTAAGQSAASPVAFVRKIDTSAQHIANPLSLAVDQQGNVYLSDSAPNPRILKYDPQGKFVLQWGSKGSDDGQFEFAPADPNAGPGTGFIAVDAQGNVYVSDGYNDRVQKFDPNGKFLAKWGSKGTNEGQFDGPLGPIYIDGQGNIYVSQFDRVQKFDPNGKFLAKYGSGGAGDGQFTGAAFGAIDSQGNFFVADLLNARVQKFDPSWKFLLKWGTAGEGDGQFAAPVAIVADSQDRLYVADNSKRIQVFDTNGKFLGQWSDPGNGDPPFVEGISGLAMGMQGNIYVTNQDGKSIYVFRARQP
jgi:tripartite motif-containing protein 71